MRPHRSLSQFALMLLLATPIAISLVTIAHLHQTAIAQITPNRKAEADRLIQQGDKQRQTSQYRAEIEFYQQALKIYRAIGDRNTEYDTLKNLASVYDYLREYPKALEVYQQALAVARTMVNRRQEANIFESIAWIYYRIKQRTLALEYFQKAMITYKDLGIKELEYEALKSIEMVQNNLFDDHPPKLGLEEQERKKTEANHLVKQATYQWDSRQPEAALQSYQQALKIYQEIQEHYDELEVLSEIRRVYWRQNNIPKTIEHAQQELVLARKLNDVGRESHALFLLNAYYRTQAEYGKAVQVANELLALAKKNHRQSSEALALSLLRETHQALGDQNTAEKYQALRAEEGRINISDQVEIYQLNLVKAREQHNPKTEIKALQDLGELYAFAGNYAKSVDYYEQGLKIARYIKDDKTAASFLEKLGNICHFGWQNQAKVIEYYQQLLNHYSKALNNTSKLVAIYHLGNAYKLSENYAKAVEYYEQYSILNPGSWYDVAKNLIESYIALGRYPKAIAYAQQKLEIGGKNPSNHREKLLLPGLGMAYQKAGKYIEALATFQEVLAISQEKRDHAYQIAALNGLSTIFSQQNKPELAIVFYKQAVNVIETIREDIRKLPRESQESYAQSVAGTYRSLANLLIQQGRLPEAQAVLELLKLGELRDFTRDAGINSTGISLAKVEETALQQILKRFTTVGNFSQRIAECEQKACSDDIQQLKAQRDQLNGAINQELNQQRAILAKYFATEGSTLTPEKLNAEARRIVNAEPGTVLIYPLILKDKIQFLLALKAGDGAVTFRPFETPNVSATQLFNIIQTFRNQLKTPGDLKALQATSKQLYDWLLKPLEPELNNGTIKHLVFAPDSTTRYIPLAALFDGKQYLIERYTITTITAASQTNTTDHLPQPTANQPFLLATGASTFASAPPLNNVPAELDAITQNANGKDTQGIYPGIELLNTAFDYAALKAHLPGTRILHIATHGKFVPGRPEDSFLLPGRGENITTALIDQLGNYGIGNVHLVVLSAWETAVGDRASDGIEIPGISYFFLKNEVKTVLASLWSVNDASTSLIMQQFYKHIAAGMTKAQALQTVQQDLINRKFTAKDAPRGSRDADVAVTGTHALRPANFSHPYYWAPFILIGNGL